jgi:hypothetical protein
MYFENILGIITKVEIRVTRSLVFCVVFCRSFCLFLVFLLANVCSVLLRFTDSDCPFGIFKLFFTYFEIQWFRVKCQQTIAIATVLIPMNTWCISNACSLTTREGSDIVLILMQFSDEFSVSQGVIDQSVGGKLTCQNLQSKD